MEQPTNADQKFVYAAFEVLSLDEIGIIFSYMEPFYIVQMCKYLKDRCEKIKWVNVLTKVTGIEFLKANYNSLLSLTDNTAQVRFNLMWPKDERDPRDFELEPKMISKLTTMNKLNSVGLETLVNIPKQSAVRYWVLVLWSWEGQYVIGVYSRYDEVLSNLEDELYSNAINGHLDNDIEHSDPQEIFDVLEKVGILDRHPSLRDEHDEFIEDPLSYFQGDYFDDYDLGLFCKYWYEIPTLKELEGFFGGGQGYYEHPVLRAFSIAHVVFIRD